MGPKTYPTGLATFTSGVDAVLDHVRKGDVYQVSLAWEETDIPVRDAASAWLHVRATNPATRGCFVRTGPVEIVSNSPELFLEIDPTTRNVRSCPIKGTASRSTGPAGLSQLKDNPKERAELTMIVDLVRNDLGKVAAPVQFAQIVGLSGLAATFGMPNKPSRPHLHPPLTRWMRSLQRSLLGP